MFGVLFGAATAGMGIGAIVTPALISGLGVRGALVATGAFLPVLVAVSWRALRKVDGAADAPTEALALLDRVPMFAPLSGTIFTLLFGAGMLMVVVSE